MTFSVLRSLHEIIGNAIDDIERVYASHVDDPRSGASSKRTSPIPAKETQSPTPPESAHGFKTDIPGAILLEKNICSSLLQQNTDEHQRNAGDAGGTDPGHKSMERRGHLSSPSNSGAYASPPPSPSVSNSITSHPPLPVKESLDEPHCAPSIDFPALDAPYDGASLSEALTTHPSVLAAIGNIVAAAGQLSAMVQTPFLTLCEAAMAYHLPSCMRLLEASHVVEILREAGPEGLNVELISQRNGVAPSKLAHVLRLLATHHLMREVAPDVFALNRLSSFVDSGKTFDQIKKFEDEGRPEMKYIDTNGIAAFVGLCTDEIQKSSAFLTETYYLSSSSRTRAGTDPARAPFCVAFDTVQSGTGFFGWLEGETGASPGAAGNCDRHPQPAPHSQASAPSSARHTRDRAISVRSGYGTASDRHGQVRKKHMMLPADPTLAPPGPPRAETGAHQEAPNPNRFRLERFGKAMSGTDGWEVPGAVLSGFDWASLARGSVVVDVGGGIGSTSMILATAFSQEGAEGGSRGLRFIIQDRAVVCEMGEKAWKVKCPELLDATVKFQVHDFFTPQPVKNAAVFLLRVVLHDWPDDFARKILLRLREAASEETKLLIADFVLPLACPDDTSSSGVLEGVEGAESVLAPAPLLPNLGKASSNVYWMDLTMQVMFNSQERTLREMVSLTLSAGWKVVKVTKTPGSLFGYLVAIPVTIPEATVCSSIETENTFATTKNIPAKSMVSADDASDEATTMQYMLERERERYSGTNSRCGTPTFGSHMRLSSASETLSRLGGGAVRSKNMARHVSTPTSVPRNPPALKPALSLSTTSLPKKKRPSPLSVPPVGAHVSPTPAQSPRHLTPSSISPKTISPKNDVTRPPQIQLQVPRTIPRRMSLAALRNPPTNTALAPPPPLPLPRSRTPASPGSARTLGRRASQASLVQLASGRGERSPVPPLPNFATIRSGAPVGMGGEPTSPGSSTHRSPHRLRAEAPPSALPQRTVTRRASSAQLPNIGLRRRAGTIVGPGLGTVLRFDGPSPAPAKMRDDLSSGPRISTGLLAAAAPIREDAGRLRGSSDDQVPL